MDKNQIELLILGASLLAPFCLFALTAFFNHRQRKRNVPIVSHADSFRALKYINIVIFGFLVVLFLKYQISLLDLLIYGIYLFLVVNVYGFVIWNGFAITDTSMHIHLLVEVFRAQKISYKGLTATYNKKKVIAARIPRLLSLGQLREKDGKLYLAGNSVLLGATVCALFRRLLGVPVRPPLGH